MTGADDQDTDTRPLAGTLVVTLEQAVAAPLCSARLADAGARVIKIERAEGDFARGYDQVARGQSAYFVWLNRGKESICLDIKDRADAALLKRMIARADVFIQNLAPGAAKRAGFGADDLRERHPGLITCDITGYPADGPQADRKSYDMLVQAESGLSSITGGENEIGRVGVSLCDIAAGMYAYEAVLEALLARAVTGRGRKVEVSLFAALADWMTVPLLHHDYGGRAPRRVGLNHPSIAPYGAYPCGEGGEIVIAIQNDREWRRFCKQVLRQPALADDPAFACNVARVENRPALDEIVRHALSTLDRDAAARLLDAAGIACAKVNSVADLSGHASLRRASVDTPAGPVDLVAPPARIDGRAPILRPVPALDQHGEALRREFAGSETDDERSRS